SDARLPRVSVEGELHPHRVVAAEPAQESLAARDAGEHAANRGVELGDGPVDMTAPPADVEVLANDVADAQRTPRVGRVDLHRDGHEVRPPPRCRRPLEDFAHRPRNGGRRDIPMLHDDDWTRGTTVRASPRFRQTTDAIQIVVRPPRVSWLSNSRPSRKKFQLRPAIHYVN